MAAGTFARKAFTCLCATALAFATMGAGVAPIASADEAGSESAVAASAPYSCDNGWQLNYSTLGGQVRIDGVAANGSGSLAIPESIDGHPVTIIGASAFKDCAQLTSVTIPESVTVFKSAAFSGTGLASVRIPASVTAISYRCFKNCTRLSDVSFEGESMLYLGQEAFMYCSALEQITLPQLTSYARYDADADDVSTPGVERFANTVSIDKSCFAQCTALTTITFGGKVGHETPNYFLDISCFNGDNALTTFIWKTKSDEVPSGTSANRQFRNQITDSYYTLDFYNSEEDAAALENRVASVTYEPKNSEDDHNMVKILSLVNGTEDYSKYKLASCSDSIPKPPAGKVWGVADNGVTGDYSTLTDSYQVIAVDEDDLAYGWVSSPDIHDYWADVEVSNTSGSMYDTNNPRTYIEPDGSVPDAQKMAVYGPDGSVLSGDQYQLAWEKAVLERTGSSLNLSVTGWNDATGVDGVGTYRVHAKNTANGTETATRTFEVREFSPSVHAYTNYSFANDLGAIDADAADLLGDGTPEYNVIVPSSDWRNQLIGAGLAGASGGLSLYDDKANVSSDAYRAHMLTGATSVQIVGSTSTVPQSTDVSKNKYLSDWLLSTITGDQTRYKNDSTPQALSRQVYNVMKGDAWSSEYGSTAVVVSGETALNTLPIAQTVYAEKAPVFFASKGKLASADLSLLRSGGFTKVIVAGSTSEVSESCVSSIASATGVTPTRVLDSGDTPCDASIAYAQQLVASGNSYGCVAVADGTRSANVTEAAQVAALGKGVVLVCNSSRDVKKVQDFLYGVLSEQGSSTIENLYLVGTFQGVDSQAQSRLTSIWSTPLSTADSATDTVAANGATYQLASGNKATLVRVSDAAGTAQSIGSFSYGGKKYTVTGVGANAFGERVTSVTLANSITSVGKNAFKGCSALKSVSIGNKLSSIGATAFSGCGKLKTLTIKSAKLTKGKIGSKAFSGVYSKATVKVPKSKIKAYKKLFQSKGLSKKATFKKC